MYFASAPAGISGFRIKCGMTKTGIPGSRIGVRNDQMTVSGAMTKARSPPAYGRKRKEKWRRGTNEGKRCLSRGESIEVPEAVKPAERLLQSEPGEFFFPEPLRHFSFRFRTSAGSFLLIFPFLLREKKREIQDARAVHFYWFG